MSRSVFRIEAVSQTPKRPCLQDWLRFRARTAEKLPVPPDLSAEPIAAKPAGSGLSLPGAVCHIYDAESCRIRLRCRPCRRATTWRGCRDRPSVGAHSRLPGTDGSTHRWWGVPPSTSSFRRSNFISRESPRSVAFRDSPTSTWIRSPTGSRSGGLRTCSRTASSITIRVDDRTDPQFSTTGAVSGRYRSLFRS